MKKLFAVALALAMLLSAFAFAEAADYVGTWYLNGIEMDGETYSPASFGMEMYIELREDGTATGSNSMAGEVDVQDGTWTAEGDTVTVTIDDAPTVFTLEDGNLVSASEEGDMKMIMGREKSEVEAYTPADPKADAALEDYAGNWSAFKLGTDGVYMDCDIIGMDLSAAIEGTTVTFNGFVFSDEAVETTFADGALSFAAEDPEAALIAGIDAQLLEDGNIMLTLTISDPMTFILQRAE